MGKSKNELVGALKESVAEHQGDAGCEDLITSSPMSIHQAVRLNPGERLRFQHPKRWQREISDGLVTYVSVHNNAYVTLHSADGSRTDRFPTTDLTYFKKNQRVILDGEIVHFPLWEQTKP